MKESKVRYKGSGKNFWGEKKEGDSNSGGDGRGVYDVVVWVFILLTLAWRSL